MNIGTSAIRDHAIGCYRHVIAPIDPGHAHHRALASAAELARLANARLTVVAVEEPHRDARRALIDAVDSITDIAVEIRVLPLRGGTSQDLCGYADRTPGSLLCMSSSAAGTMREAVLHPVSSEVLGRVRRPIALVGARHRSSGRWSEIVAFVDGSAASVPEARMATDLAVSFGLPLTFLRVLPESRSAGPDDVTEDADLRRYAADALLAGHQVTWDVLHDRSPSRGIVTWLAHRPSVLAVLGAHGHPGRSHLREPSVVVRVTRRISGCVLVVPADVPPCVR